MRGYPRKHFFPASIESLGLETSPQDIANICAFGTAASPYRKFHKIGLPRNNESWLLSELLNYIFFQKHVYIVINVFEFNAYLRINRYPIGA